MSMVAETRASALSASGLSKAFGDNVALDAVNLEVPAGTIHALVGMNGSGKSTVVKILAGFYQRDGGEIFVGGDSNEVNKRIAFVHQDLALVESLSVVENLSLGQKVKTKHGQIDRVAERMAAVELLKPFQLEHTTDWPVHRLTKAEKTIVAIVRALQSSEGSSLLVLDEPTSTLPTQETDRLLGVARQCADSGLGVLFISHRLGEVIRASDEVTVLRNGKAVLNAPTSELSVESIVSAMGGTRPAPPQSAASPVTGVANYENQPVVLKANNLAHETLDGVSFAVRRGEVLAIAGVLGSGVEELGALLSGRTKPTTGTVDLHGKPVGPQTSKVGYVPSNRASQAVLSGLSARENGTIANLGKYLHRGRINTKRERMSMTQWFADMKVHPPKVEADMLSLSGGNQQKVLFARWLSVNPDVIVADEPTQGVDVYAKSDILTKLREYATDGLAVVLISGEPEEIASACDRMIVINHGRNFREFEAPVDVAAVFAEMHKGELHEHNND